MTPGLLRRLASILYEALLLFAVGFFASWLFFFASGGRDATQGILRHELQLFILFVYAAYFLRCWLYSGQTVAMKAWRIKVVDITPWKAVQRLFWAALFVPTGVSILWALFDHEKQFLHDRLARTRLVSV